jgi:hypothetical protein
LICEIGEIVGEQADQVLQLLFLAFHIRIWRVRFILALQKRFVAVKQGSFSWSLSSRA